MSSDKKNIIVLGAGFAGITAVLSLEHALKDRKNAYRIILIDRHEHQLYTPALYEIASIPREMSPDAYLQSSILIPVTDIIRDKDIEFIKDELTGVYPSAKTIELKNRGQLDYEYLLLALGSETNYFNIPGLKEHSFPLKTFDDAVRLRNAVEDFFQKKQSIRIIVAGAGSTGVELVAESVNFICAIKDRVTKIKTNVCDVTFTLLDGWPEILPNFSPAVVRHAKKRLQHLGVRIITGSSIAQVGGEEITFKDETCEHFDILIWAGGVKGPRAFKQTELILTPKDTLSCDEFLRVIGGDEKIFAAGDNASVMNKKTSQPIIWNVPAAEAEARHAIINIIRAIEGKALIPFNPPASFPFVLAIGKKYAIAQIGILRCSGIIGWMIKQLVTLRYFMSVLPAGKALTLWKKGINISASND